MSQQLYTAGEYLKKNPTCHVEEFPWKARQVVRMLTDHHLCCTGLWYEKGPR